MDEVEEPRRERDPQRLKAAYFEWASPEAARARLETHVRFHEDARASYEKQREDILARRVPLLLARLERTPASEQDAVVEFRAFAYSGLIARPARRSSGHGRDCGCWTGSTRTGPKKKPPSSQVPDHTVNARTRRSLPAIK
ncbi:hypothetical protein [Streptomyces sp. NBC_01340]|uniref:hypothetical protein n=1 Tax=Streptomyces sp. NBC_01340 TaxID=2903830 RepID=UPI003DA5EAA3